MTGFTRNIEQLTLDNTNYRQVIYTSHYMQLVVMCLQPGEEIGNEVHGLDQFIRLEQGNAKVVLDNGAEEHDVADDWAVIIPAGTYHNVINTGDQPVKLYTIYSPPEHRVDVVQPTKADEAEEHFDGRVS